MINKKAASILFVMIFMTAQGKAITGAPDATFAIGQQTLWMQARAVVEQSEAYQQLAQLYANYRQAQEYYDYMKKLNEHKGGIAGAIAEDITTASKAQFEKDKDAMLEDAQGKDKTNYIRSLKESIDQKAKDLRKEIEGYRDDAKERIENARTRQTLLDGYITKISQKNLTANELKEAEMQKGALAAVQIERIIELLEDQEKERTARLIAAAEYKEKLVTQNKKHLEIYKAYTAKRAKTEAMSAAQAAQILSNPSYFLNEPKK